MPGRRQGKCLFHRTFERKFRFSKENSGIDEVHHSQECFVRETSVKFLGFTSKRWICIVSRCCFQLCTIKTKGEDNNPCLHRHCCCCNLRSTARNINSRLESGSFSNKASDSLDSSSVCDCDWLADESSNKDAAIAAACWLFLSNREFAWFSTSVQSSSCLVLCMEL